MRASAAEAIAAARRDTTCTPGMCLAYVVRWWAAPSIGCPDAITSWNWALDKHPGDRDPPAGAPVFYSGGKHGHIALSLGDGRILRSTDCSTTGTVGEADLDWPTRAWGYPYLGWTGDLSKVMLPLQGEDDMPLTDDDVARIWAFTPGGKPDSVGTILFRLNPGPAGLVSAVAGGVWALMSTSALDGARKSVLELLRSAERAARQAAGK